jgi:hypothetical protein
MVPPHLREGGRHAREFMATGKGPREKRHLVAARTALGHAADVYPMAGLDPVRTNVYRAAGSEDGRTDSHRAQRNQERDRRSQRSGRRAPAEE